MSRSLQRGGWELGIVVGLGITGACAPSSNYVLAQLKPDTTLGAESSFITPQDPLTDRIDGGARRGANLFHSFLEFNVDQGRGVYFSNPSGIENIISRVTGGKPSQILGRLGVLGEANLFLLNPQGILFGSNANLDIKGSFLATTADAINLGEQEYFSAAEPQNSQLLSVTPGVLFFNAVANQYAAITNRGNLATGQNLTLAAGNLELEGQLSSGKNLTLQAVDTVWIRDNMASPFIASAGGQLLIQGNQRVEIFALNNPESSFFSGGDMVLRSANTVGGEAHYTTGGSFRIEQLDGSLGNLFSLHEPVIRANGDVSLSSYTGASLHISAGGKVEIPDFVWIQGSDPINGIVDNVTLSDGTTVSINGRTQPTLDVRAGTNTFGSPLTNTATPTSADIRIGTIFFKDAASAPLAGRILLTNQYQPNPLLNGDLQFTASPVAASQRGFLSGMAMINGDVGSGGFISINSRDSITLNGIVDASANLASGNYLGNGGDVTLLANGDITLPAGSAIRSFGLSGGNITLKSNAAISATGGMINSTNMSNVPGTRGGEINVIARSLSLTNGAQVSAAPLGTGNAGSVMIQASDSITFDGVASNGNASGVVVASETEGNGGNINITTRSLSVTNGAQLEAATLGKGNAGNVRIQASDSITFDGVASNGNPSGVVVASETEGNGGDINITTRSLLVTNGAQLVAGTSETGNAGSVTIRASDLVSVANDSVVGANSEGAGNPGNVTITTQRLNVTQRSRVSVSNLGSATGGELDITAGSILLDNQGQLTAETNSGEGGNIRLKVPGLLLMRRNSSISTEARGADGNSGNININTKFLVAIPSENSDIIASAAKGGNIGISTRGIFGIQFRESLTPESDITATGTVTLDTPDVDIQSGLNQLNANFVNPDQAIASSCLARRNSIAGSFTVTGTGGLPLNPYETLSSGYPVTAVQGLPPEAKQQASSPIPNSQSPIPNHWKLGDPVQEAQGMTVTADGRIIAATAPQLVAAAKAQELVCY